MSVKPQSISDLAEYWDELTPVQQQFKMKADGAWKGEELYMSTPKSDNEPIIK